MNEIEDSLNKLIDIIIDDFRYVIDAYLDLTEDINSLDPSYEKRQQIESIYKKYFEE